MKERLLNYCMNNIKNNYQNYSNDKLEIIKYGLESLYLTLTKIILILFLSIILNILKYVILILITYNIIRFYSFGMHAKKSWQCLIISLILFIGGVYICNYINISIIIKSLLSLMCILLMYKYAPADTEKRPLINKKKRTMYKLFSVITAGIYAMLIIIFDNNLISNYLLLGLTSATLMILPITYKLFKLPYDNYKRYKTNVV